MSFTLKIVTPERVAYEASVDSLTAMTADGEVTILPGHAPLVSTLRAGEAKVKVGADESFLAISTGFLEVRPGNQVVILADTAERMEELDLEKIKEAKERAIALMSEKHVDDTAFANAAALMERELAREKVALRRHHNRGPHIQS